MKSEVDATSPRTEENRKLIAQASEYFVLSSGTQRLVKKIQEAVQNVDETYDNVGFAFQHNILATIAVVEMPFMLVCAAVDRGHFQRLHIAERIQAEINTVRAGQGSNRRYRRS